MKSKRSYSIHSTDKDSPRSHLYLSEEARNLLAKEAKAASMGLSIKQYEKVLRAIGAEYFHI